MQFQISLLSSLVISPLNSPLITLSHHHQSRHQTLLKIVKEQHKQERKEKRIQLKKSASNNFSCICSPIASIKAKASSGSKSISIGSSSIKVDIPGKKRIIFVEF